MLLGWLKVLAEMCLAGSGPHTLLSGFGSCNLQALVAIHAKTHAAPRVLEMVATCSAKMVCCFHTSTVEGLGSGYNGCTFNCIACVVTEPNVNWSLLNVMSGVRLGGSPRGEGGICSGGRGPGQVDREGCHRSLS